MMQRDRQTVLIYRPQFAEHQLRLHARVDEHQRQLVPPDRVIDAWDRIARQMPRPRRRRLQLQDLDLRLRPALGHHEVGQSDTILTRRLRLQIGTQLRWPRHRGRQSDGQQLRRERPQPRHVERQQVAPLRGGKRMKLVQDQRVEIRKQIWRVGMAQHQRQLLRRRQQNVRRLFPLPRPPRRRRIARPRLRLDGQAHLADRHFEIARDVRRQRLQRRNVKRMQPGPLPRLLRFGKLDEARQKPRERLARPRRRNQQGRAARLCLGQQRQLMLARRPAARRRTTGQTAAATAAATARPARSCSPPPA